MRRIRRESRPLWERQMAKETGPFPGAGPDFTACEAMLRGTYAEIRHLHDTPAAQAFIAGHWNRYVRILRSSRDSRKARPCSKWARPSYRAS